MRPALHHIIRARQDLERELRETERKYKRTPSPELSNKINLLNQQIDRSYELQQLWFPVNFF